MVVVLGRLKEGDSMEITEEEAKTIIGLLQHFKDVCGFLQPDQEELDTKIRRIEFRDLFHYRHGEY